MQKESSKAFEIVQVTNQSKPEITFELTPNLGGNFLNFQMHKGNEAYDIMPEWAPDIENTFRSSMYACVPYPNRIRDGKFIFDGLDYLINDLPAEHALHGYLHNRELEFHGSISEVSLDFDSRKHLDITYPFPFTASIIYGLEDDEFYASIELKNVGTRFMPAGVCFHPYFSRSPNPTMHEEDPLVSFNVAGVYPAQDDVPLPVAPLTSLEPELDFSKAKNVQAGLDHCFAGWDGQVHIEWPKSQITAKLLAQTWTSYDKVKRSPSHLVVYSTPEVFAIEPQSMMIDGFNKMNDPEYTNHGVEVLGPNESLYLRFSLVLSSEKK